MGKIGFLVVIVIIFSIGLIVLSTAPMRADPSVTFPLKPGPTNVAIFKMDYSPSGQFSFRISCFNGTYDVYVVTEANLHRFMVNESYGYIQDFSRENITGNATLGGVLATGSYGIIVNPHQASTIALYNDVAMSPISTSTGSLPLWEWIVVIVVSAGAGASVAFLLSRRMSAKGR